MDTTTIGELAARTGSSRPTVRRVVQHLGLAPVRDADGRVALGAAGAQAVVQHLGCTPRVDGFTKAEVQALAALARSPRGLRSARALARASGLSPTTASKVLGTLSRRGYVEEERRVLAEGRPVEATVWRLVVTDPRWLSVAAAVTSTVPPDRPVREARPQRVPRRFWHLFWNGDPASLDPAGADSGFVATRMLLSNQPDAVAWALGSLPRAALERAASNRGADARTRSMIANAVRHGR